MMNNKVHDGITYALSSVSVLFGFADIEQLLNIILIILGIVNFVLIISFKIYSVITNKNTDNKQTEINKVISEGKKEIEKIKGGIHNEVSKETDRDS